MAQAQSNKRPVQAVDAGGRSITTFAESLIGRMPVPADGKWHRVAADCPAVRLHVFGGRNGVLYTTSLSGGAVVDGAPVDAASIAHSIPLAAGAPYTLTFNVPAEVFVCADPDAAGPNAPIVGVVQSAVSVY